jgi:hypothetical protein
VIGNVATRGLMEFKRHQMHQARKALELHPKCGAKCKRTGKPCKNASKQNGRCRMHVSSLSYHRFFFQAWPPLAS